MTTPLEALTRAGHKYPQSILDDLKCANYFVISAEEYNELLVFKERLESEEIYASMEGYS